MSKQKSALTIVLTSNQRQTRRNRVLPSSTPSKQAEVFYRKRLLALLSEMSSKLLSALKLKLNDAEDTEENKIKPERFLAALAVMSAVDISAFADRTAKDYLSLLGSHNNKQSKRIYKEALGIDIPNIIGREALQDKLQEAIKDNIGYITSIKNDFINDIGSHVMEGFSKGKSYADLAKTIRELTGVNEAKARFIARDQTSKITADFSRIREKALGNDLYYWLGTDDERERDSHKALNGMLCKYSDPGVYSDDDGKTWKKRSTIKAYEGDVGKDYNCRCKAKPYINLKDYQ